MKPIVKGSDKSMAQWLVGELPEHYDQMIFVDTMCGDLSLFLGKRRSRLDILNDPDANLINLYRAVRDEYRDMSRRVNNLKCSEDSFQKHLANMSKQSDDYMDRAISELAIRKMSKAEKKVSYSGKPVDWKLVCKDLLSLSKSLQETFLMSKDGLEVIQKFNHSETILLHTLQTGQREQQYNKLANTLRNFSGLAMVVCHDQKVHKSHFSAWKLKKKMLSINGKKKAHYIWKNF